MYLSVIIPCYNEEKRIGNTLKAIRDYLSKKDFQSEIIVVENGSEDKTEEVVKNLEQQIPNLKLIKRHDFGKGFAVKEGMLEASGQFRLFTDADNSTDIKQADLLLKALNEDNDVAIGSRKIYGAQISNPQPFHRVFLGNIFQLLVSLIFPIGIKDTQNGFKMFNKKATKLIFTQQKDFYWAFDVEILALAQKMGLKIKEVPIIWNDNEKSKMNLKGMIRMLWEIITIRLGI